MKKESNTTSKKGSTVAQFHPKPTMAKLALDIVIVRLLGSQSEGSWVQLTVGLKTATSHGFSILSKSFLISSCGLHFCKWLPRQLILGLSESIFYISSNSHYSWAHPTWRSLGSWRPRTLAKQKAHFNFQMAVSGFLYHTHINTCGFFCVYVQDNFQESVDHSWLLPNCYLVSTWPSSPGLTSLGTSITCTNSANG